MPKSSRCLQPMLLPPSRKNPLEVFLPSLLTGKRIYKQEQTRMPCPSVSERKHQLRQMHQYLKHLEIGLPGDHRNLLMLYPLEL